MFGFVRPAACRSSAPRSVTDGCPYPPLPCRAKNRNKIQLSSHRKQEINGNGGDSFHRPRGGPPPSRREVWGLRAHSRIFFYCSGSRVATLLVSKGVMGFLGDLRGRNSKSPPNPLGLAERVPRPAGGGRSYQAVEGVNPIFEHKDCKKTSGLLYYNIRSGLPSAVPAPHPSSERTWQREKAHPLIFGHPRRVRPDFC